MTLFGKSPVELIGGAIGLVAVFVAIFALRFLVKAVIAVGLIQMGVPRGWAFLLAWVIGVGLLAGLAYLFKPLWTRIEAWAEKDDA